MAVMCPVGLMARWLVMSGINALTCMQSPAGLFRTFFQLVNEKKPGAQRPNWYSQHLYTVCHVLEGMPCLPELVPQGEDHLLGGNGFVRDVRYAPGKVSFTTVRPARTVLKLGFVPKAVYAGSRELSRRAALSSDARLGWSFDLTTSRLTVCHDGGPIDVLRSSR